MPKTTPLFQDPRTFVLLADGKPLMKAIPKRYLAWLTWPENYGTQGALAKQLSTGWRTIHRQTVNGWISGKLHMSNRDVIHVSHVLDVSPLCVLDLCAPNETESPAAYTTRYAMAANLQLLKDWQNTGEKPKQSDILARAWLADSVAEYGAIATAEGLRDRIRAIQGDYRDLQRLAVDTASYYAETCEPDKQGNLITRIVEAGRAYSTDVG